MLRLLKSDQLKYPLFSEINQTYVSPILGNRTEYENCYNLAHGWRYFKYLKVIQKISGKLFLKVMTFDEFLMEAKKSSFNCKKLAESIANNLTKKRNCTVGLNFSKLNVMGVINITPDSFYNKSEKIRYKLAYKNQQDDLGKKKFKKIMNYYGDLKLKKKILDYLLEKFEIKIKPRDYYLNEKEIKYLSSLGMVIGSHTNSHTLLSRISYIDQFKELNESKIFLEKIINKNVETFCYPYGGKDSYNSNTLKILKKLKYKLAYSVEYRDISSNDIQNNPYELPRYDCNLF